MNHSQLRALQCLVIGVAVCAAPALATEPPDKDQDSIKEDLAERLLRKALSDGDEGIMASMIRLMGRIHERLELSFDPGEETQRLQQKIIDKLERAIEQAAARRRISKNNKPRVGGDKRRMQQGEGQKKAGRDSKAADAQGSASDNSTSTGQPQGDGMTGDAEFDVRRGWGALPPREREEVIQGAGEEYLEAYRVWIERYYRALQDTDD